ncbi:short-subunit dehydrogenase [Paraburkholderia sp. Cpub6]|nr:short-subunit dehydrogenase [Paraburkholderia sp. Cpub6]
MASDAVTVQTETRSGDVERKGVVVITGASAGVGRASASEFARQGYDVGLIAREPRRLARAAEEIAASYGVRALAIPADVADADAIERAAQRVKREWGGIDVWVNVAMATAFAPVSALSARDVERGTQVTYLGQVNGMLAALPVMRACGHGTIVNVGSALGYRSVPLQAIYCGAKFAVRGFTDSLRSELLHDGVDIHLTMVDLPAVNTPQFDWALNRTGRRARPVAPVFQPEVAARAIYFAATHRRRQVWVGWSTVKAILANRIAPALLDRYLARAGYDGQLTDEPLPADAPANLYEPVPGHYTSHGRFDDEARAYCGQMFTDRHRNAVYGAAVMALAGGVAWLLRRKRP